MPARYCDVASLPRREARRRRRRTVRRLGRTVLLASESIILWIPLVAPYIEITKKTKVLVVHGTRPAQEALPSQASCAAQSDADERMREPQNQTQSLKKYGV